MKLEHVIFSNLLTNEDYARKVIPHLRTEYFQDYIDGKIYNLIDSYLDAYNSLPSKEALLIDLSNASGFNEEQFKEAEQVLKNLSKEPTKDKEWLTEQTEKFCQDKAIYNAIRASIQILDAKDSELGKGSIPNLLSDALSISFDNSIGHSYTDDGEARYEFYHRVDERVPFDLEYLNKITKGGLPKKTLTILLGGTGAGKSLVMCHMASANLLMGKNVLYITKELAEERIAERIDANLMNTPLDELATLPKDTFMKRLNRIKEKTPGKLIIKEYPTSSAGAANFRHLLNELRIKKNFIPDIIYVDYMNICISSRLKGANVNSYMYVKAIAEELRGLAVEFNVPLVTATQVNRCLALDTKVEHKSRGYVDISSLKVGDEILSSDDNYVTVKHIYPIAKQKTFRVKLKSGLSVICSQNHIFPTVNGLSSIDSGLKPGDKLFAKSMRNEIFLDEIISIEECGELETLDIEVSGNRLFYANNILTHNSGMDNSDLDLTHTSESMGAPATADLLLAIIATEELLALNQYLIKQLKNRFSDIEKNKRFVIGVDKSKMRLYNVEEAAQHDILTETPQDSMQKPDKSKFQDFK